MRLVFKRDEVLVENNTSKNQTSFGDSKITKGKVAIVGSECEKYVVGETILFKDLDGFRTNFEYDGKKYYMMPEKLVICGVDEQGS